MLHFIRPAWLLALPLAVLLPWWWRHARRPAGDWEKVCDAHLLRWLSVGRAGTAASARGAWLAGLALLIAVLALAGPSWQRLPGSTFSAREARVIAFDLSASMLAEDLRPNRLARARFRVADLLAEMQEGQTGLVAYAGDAFVVSPLTNDMNTIANLLPALQADIMPVKGSRADRALELAAQLLERAGFSAGEVLLVTDSATAGDAAQARMLRDRGIITSVLALGTAQGAPIPSGSGFVSDAAGNIVIARLDAASLREVATAGQGQYTELGAQLPGTGTPWAIAEGGEFTRRDEALDEQWKDAGPFLVVLLLPLAAAGFRRGVFFLFPLALASVLLQPRPAHASWWEDAWARKDQQAWKALQQQQNERAAALAENPELAGEAWYRAGKFDQAMTSWSRSESAAAHYNRGNALAQMGEYEAALQAYDQALALRADMTDAQFNREIVEQLLQQQEKEQQEKEQQERESAEQQSAEQAADSASAEQQQGEAEGEPAESQESSEEPQQGEGEAGEQAREEQMAAWSEEDAQAMEQWLERIPDDPGGLLRRKFIYEHQRRGAPPDEEESW